MTTRNPLSKFYFMANEQDATITFNAQTFRDAAVPIYVAPGHSECQIECPDLGGAYYIPPYDCVTWCGPSPVAAADLMTRGVALQGWDFISSLKGSWIGQSSAAFPLALRASDAPENVKSALGIIRRLANVRGNVKYSFEWNDLTLTKALNKIVDTMRAN